MSQVGQIFLLLTYNMDGYFRKLPQKYEFFKAQLDKT